MTTAEEVFVYRYEQLCQILADTRVVELPDLSQILRLFLVDQPNIVDSVNKQHRLEILFPKPGSTEEALATRASALPIPSFLFEGFSTEVNKGETITRDQFLLRTPMYANGHHYSYRHIIWLCANKLGGIHWDESFNKDTNLLSLLNLNQSREVAEAPSVLYVLRHVGLVTQEGLQELYNLVSTQTALS